MAVKVVRDILAILDEKHLIQCWPKLINKMSNHPHPHRNPKQISIQTGIQFNNTNTLKVQLGKKHRHNAHRTHSQKANKQASCTRTQYK